ncbi:MULTISPECIES: hypothetical protein [unclassified Streptomyces]|uniref:hypothetical protein n=1 Tax=unclassified Streptomyces TaxID=2593676 RepID=UPI002DD8E111|nr:hypothetical protein [Streptomyces sp. NBC_01751]WSD29290.1 hypothetical protein OHA26_41060 [Streptomyces sp. NBC_01751]WSF82382.1 hypothetical protein OIE70_04090 [Streptomyces sp. NBC_01744]
MLIVRDVRCRVGDPAQRRQAGHEAVLATPVDDEWRQPLETAADRLARDGEPAVVVHADQRVLFRGRPNELAVVHPLPLRELELPVQVRSDKGEHDAAVGAVVLQHSLGQRRAIGRTAHDHAVQAHLVGDDRVPRVHPPGVGAHQALEALRVVAVHEGVVPLGVGTKFRIVLVQSQRQRGATGPAADELGRQQLLVSGVFGAVAEVLTEVGYLCANAMA